MSVGELVCKPAQSRADTPPVDAVRGFVFVSGMRWFERRGKLDAFLALLPREIRERAPIITAAEWIDVEDALAVYTACDGLDVSPEDQLDIGRFVVLANNGVMVNTLLRLIGRMGSPWLALEHVDSVWRKSNRGGAIAVYKLAEKSARLEYWNVPLARSRFFVTTMRGSVAAGLEPFCRGRVFVTELAESRRSDSFALRVAW
jgi:hypothetical protein